MDVELRPEDPDDPPLFASPPPPDIGANISIMAPISMNISICSFRVLLTSRCNRACSVIMTSFMPMISYEKYSASFLSTSRAESSTMRILEVLRAGFVTFLNLVGRIQRGENALKSVYSVNGSNYSFNLPKFSNLNPSTSV